MTTRHKLDTAQKARMLAELRRDMAERLASYRVRALKLLPHVCARCAREFSGRRLRELTVHHKDLNHENNPPDGSNWELLCIYCHEDQHAVAGMKAGGGDAMPLGGLGPAPMGSPFEKLDQLVSGRKEPDAIPASAPGRTTSACPDGSTVRSCRSSKLDPEPETCSDPGLFRKAEAS